LSSKRYPRRAKERGQTLAEFALVLPVLFLLAFGIVEMGRLFHAYVTVQHSAREATRYAVTGKSDVVAGNRLASIQQVAQNHATMLAQNPTVTVRSRASVSTPSFTNNSAGGPCDQVEVQVSYEFEFLFDDFFGLLSAVDLEASERMIAEQWDDCDL
jgi:Flp pilus assembly protein TadG